MKHLLSGLALCSFLVVGLAVGAPAQAASASIGSAVSAQSGDASVVVKVHDRKRHHRRWRRHHRPRAGFFFEFGTRPYYRPPYYAPRYEYPRPVYRLSKAHVRWCYNRYRSYRASDNTFQPYHGPRKPCISPYMRRY